jgi:hypothetical protein
MSRFACLLLCVLALLLPGCLSSTGRVASPDQSQAEPADKVTAAVTILESTLSTLEDKVTVALATYPDKIAAINAKVGPILTAIKEKVAEYKAAAASGGQTKWLWSLAWPALVKAGEVLIPQALALVAGK